VIRTIFIVLVDNFSLGLLLVEAKQNTAALIKLFTRVLDVRRLDRPSGHFSEV
jgi:hypothetical protein